MLSNRPYRPLVFKLTILITVIMVLVVTIITALTIQRERQNFQRELEQQAVLLLNTIAAASADALIFVDGDFLNDLMVNLGEENVLIYGRVYDQEGRVVADAIDPASRFGIEPDLFGKVLLASGEPIFQWEGARLLAGQAVRVGSGPVGAISVGLPTAPLDAKITAVRNQGLLTAVVAIMVGLFLALIVSRSITNPLQQMIRATQQIRKGDLSQRVNIQTNDELGVLGNYFNEMTAQLEQTLHQMEMEIEERKRAQAEVETAMEAAENANKAKSTFLANMSHELRTPLNAILGFSKITERKYATSPEAKKNLRIINRSGEHLLMLINQVLDMSKIEAGRMTLLEKEFNLYRMLEDLEGMFRMRAQEQDVEFLLSCDIGVPGQIIADEMKLRQVLINLIGNALKFTQAGFVRLHVHYERVTAVADDPPTHKLHFSVEDTGPGIEPEELEMLFEAFVRAKAGRESGQGTGLGLSLSRQFVHLMGGELSVRNVQNEPGHGAIFDFFILMEPVETPPLPSKENAQPIQVGRLAPNQPEQRVLVVDDSWENRQMLVQLLQPLGFVVQEAENGRVAIDIWRSWQPQLILMDLQMPVMTGFEAINLIKSDPAGDQTIIIAITASAFNRERDTLLSAGCHDFLLKPVQPQQILESIQTHTAVQYEYLPEAEPEIEPRWPVDGRIAQNLDGTQETMATAVAKLPPHLRTQLHQATAQANMDLIEKQIQEITPYSPMLAQNLRNLAEDFEYGKILEILQVANNS
jgi:signal transduction histidine kinase/CheY-like chemotaxis protein